ncbi:phage tail protein [Emticicia sp. 17c]|uniref:phage tail protein n=1 Tax=Emticicia sp. 17c TaxID=3127704 RepID=UPI00301DEFF0
MAKQNQETKSNYPPVGFHFKVEFNLPNGLSGDIHFQEVSGLNKEMTTEEFTEGGENRFLYHFPKGTKYPNLVLKRGMKPESDVIQWVKDAIDNFDFKPATVSVILLNDAHKPLVKWEFLKAFPVKWASSDLKAQENAIVIETLELNYQYYNQVTV